MYEDKLENKLYAAKNSAVVLTTNCLGSERSNVGWRQVDRLDPYSLKIPFSLVYLLTTLLP